MNHSMVQPSTTLDDALSAVSKALAYGHSNGIVEDPFEQGHTVGVVAQLVERLNGIQEVAGSNPVGSTGTAENSLKDCVVDADVHGSYEPLSPLVNLPVLQANTAVGVRNVPSVADAVSAVLESKIQSRRRPTYITSLRQYLRSFSKGKEEKPINQISSEDVENWFAGRDESPSTRSSNVGRLSALFSFAIRRKWISVNPCDSLERVSIDHSAPSILLPVQVRSLLQKAHHDLLPWILLGLFAGLRPSESARLSWSDVRLKAETPRIVVDASASKTRRRRVFDLHPTAAAWLRTVARDSGPTAPPHSTLRRRRRELCEAIGMDWPQDVLRHTYASMRIGSGAPVDAVASEMGNSPKILLTHYRELVSREDADEFWRILPTL